MDVNDLLPLLVMLSSVAHDRTWETIDLEDRFDGKYEYFMCVYAA